MNGTILTEGEKGNEGILGKAAPVYRIPAPTGSLQMLVGRWFMGFKSPVERRG
jgi:hypothetical protein